MPANYHVTSVHPSHLLAQATQTNAIATATATGTAGFEYNVTSIVLSTAGTISAADVVVTLTRTRGGATETTSYGIPAAQVMPFGLRFGPEGLRSDPGTDVVATCSALGAGVTSFLNVMGRKLATA